MTDVVTLGLDLRPVFEQVVLPFFATIATGLASVAVAKIVQLTHAKLTAEQATRLEAAIQNGINFALAKAKEYENAHGVVQVKQDLVGNAMFYLTPKVPEVLKALKITPEGLAERIEARLEGRGHA